MSGKRGFRRGRFRKFANGFINGDFAYKFVFLAGPPLDIAVLRRQPPNASDFTTTGTVWPVTTGSPMSR